jgi:hypothetical protein
MGPPSHPTLRNAHTNRGVLTLRSTAGNRVRATLNSRGCVCAGRAGGGGGSVAAPYHSDHRGAAASKLLCGVCVVRWTGAAGGHAADRLHGCSMAPSPPNRRAATGAAQGEEQPVASLALQVAPRDRLLCCLLIGPRPAWFGGAIGPFEKNPLALTRWLARCTESSLNSVQVIF